MAAGLGEQIDSTRTFDQMIAEGPTPWRDISESCRDMKIAKHRRERRRAKRDPECVPQYRRYWGYQF